ncbi:CLUMA_CG010765, isoform A [Clunio marinus]|uniref:CLUMA_CG010765, isoform A n=1 Tax=Clunio marinus TaxID=568069 RepID=A0A1J1IEE6_9DIPT|nr:CLUMA_CG010765, isoform A [Clunio marinus]
MAKEWKSRQKGRKKLAEVVTDEGEKQKRFEYKLLMEIDNEEEQNRLQCKECLGFMSMTINLIRSECSNIY